MDRQALKILLASFFGEAAPLTGEFSSISDMDKLIKLWTENLRDPGVQGVIEARMAVVINTLSVDKAEEIPEWFTTIVKDEMLLPLKLLRTLFREKARQIYSRL